MTTVVATPDFMCADRQVNPGPLFETTKLRRIRGSIYGICGNLDLCMSFLLWRMQKLDELTLSADAEFAALEINEQGMWYWNGSLVPMPIKGKHYAIGSGAQYALGALDSGKSPQEAIRVASGRDEHTGRRVQTLRLRR